MEILKKILSCCALVLFITSCQEEEPNLEVLVVPTGLEVSSDISTDGSGIVNFIATANNAITYKYFFSDGTSEVSPSGSITKRFSMTGLNTYLVTVVSSGVGGVSTSISFEVEVESDFSDEEAIQFLTAGGTKTWYLAASEPAHLGVGATLAFLPDQFWFPGFFPATPFEKCSDEISSCLCNDELTFTLNGNQLTYELNNNGSTFFNVGHQDIVGGTVGEDACFEFDASGTSVVSLSPTSVDWSLVPDPAFNSRGTVMDFSNDAFMGYYVGSSTYEILEITNNFLHVRTIDGNDSNLAWYHKFSTTPVGITNETFESVFNNLVWSDEFETNGAPDSANWTYDLGAGGWGNGELQTYTNNPENVIVEDGLLKITAKADGNGGYTSTRLKSENLYEFTYGRVEVRAKLPAAQGTWPAIWMLGANFDTVSWPASGEIDIMEQTGQDKNKTLGALHFPGNSGGNALTSDIPNSTSTSEFHNYTLEWTTGVIKLLVDDEEYFTFDNSTNTPYNLDFFMILNIAMGGTLGGTIDPAFTSDTMEIDYVRVYQ